MQKIFTILTLAACLGIFTSITSDTQAAPNDGTTKTVNIDMDSKSLFRRDFYTLELLHAPHQSESEFTVRLASYGDVAGCAEMSSASVETETVLDTIKIDVRNSEPRIDRRQPRYTNYDCETKILKSYFDIEMDRDELIEKGIEKVKLTNERYGDFTTSEIDVSKEKIDWWIKSEIGEYLHTLWFFPKNTVILHAPAAKQGQDVQPLIRDFGMARGLTPIEDKYKDYELPHDALHYAYFTDPTGYIVNQLDEIGDNVAVGEIVPTRTVHGPNGAREEPYPITVHATLPGRKEMEKAAQKK